MADGNRISIHRTQKDIAGFKHPDGRLTAIRIDPERTTCGRGGRTFWVCTCECGRTVSASRKAILNGHTRSCGCLVAEGIRKRSTKHGEATSDKSKRRSEYNVWILMHRRCVQACEANRNYANRGISVCMGLRDFPAFMACLGQRPSKAHSIDRINNDGHYSCGECEQCKENWWSLNVRWATRGQQNANTRRRHEVEFNGKRMSVTEWERELGWKRGTVSDRLHVLGWSVQDALTTPPTDWNQIAFRGRLVSWTEIERMTGVPRKTIRTRVARGMTVEAAVSQSETKEPAE